MNRIDQTFKTLKRNRKKAFVAFVTAGDPSLNATQRLVLSFERSGVDLIELGVPFSDPLADGPTIQAASQRSLKNHVSLNKILSMVKRIRKRSQIPITLMTYYNPIFHYGESRFIKRAKASGVDGLIIPDLPPEEGSSFIQAARAAGLSTIFFISPTTTRKRSRQIAKVATGFIYYVSLTGVTGARQSLPASLITKVKSAKKLTNKPICVGFGVSNASQIKMIAKIADGVIVGSAIIKEIERNKGRKDLVKNVSRFVQRLSKGLR